MKVHRLEYHITAGASASMRVGGSGIDWQPHTVAAPAWKQWISVRGWTTPRYVRLHLEAMAKVFDL
jgi:hypothetical protein